MNQKHKLRVCFVGPMLGRHPGWVPNPSEFLAPRLEARGYECLLVSSKINRYQRLADILATIWRQRKRIDILCLQVYSGPSFVIEDSASCLARLLGIPVVMTLRGGELPVFLQRFPGWSKRVFGRAQVIVSPSAFLAKAAASHHKRIKIIPNAIEIENYPRRPHRSIRPSLLWMRTFHDVYNPIMAVDVFANLKKEYHQARLTLAGQEKGLIGEVRKRVEELALTDSVRFAGFLDTHGKQKEFARHDIFLNTNRVDNMPVSVVEAAAFGMPIVATAVGGVPYIIQDGENGLLTPNEDVNAMTEAVRRLLSESGLAERLSKNARAFAECHDWSVVLPQWESLFQEVMDRRH